MMNRTTGLVVYNIDESTVLWNFGTFILPDWLWVVGDNSTGKLPTLLPGSIWQGGNDPFPIHSVAQSRGDNPAVNLPIIQADNATLCWVSPATSPFRTLRGSVVSASGILTLLRTTGGDVPPMVMDPMPRSGVIGKISVTGDLNAAEVAALYNRPLDEGTSPLNVPSMFNGLATFDGPMNFGPAPRISFRWDNPGIENLWSMWKNSSSINIEAVALQRSNASTLVGTEMNLVSAESVTMTGGAMPIMERSSAEWLDFAAHTAVGGDPSLTGVRALPGLLIVEGTAGFNAPSMVNFFTGRSSSVPEECADHRAMIADSSAELDFFGMVSANLFVDITGTGSMMLSANNVTSATVSGDIRVVMVASNLADDDAAIPATEPDPAG